MKTDNQLFFPYLNPLSPGTHRKLEALRKRLGLASIDKTVAALLHSAGKSGPNLRESRFGQKKEWFERVYSRKAAGCEPLRGARMSARVLIGEAARHTGHAGDLDGFITEAAIEHSIETIIAKTRAQSGVLRAKGSADAEIAAAVVSLHQQGHPVTVSAVRRATGKNQTTIKNFLLMHGF
jgi:hypothetical protein